MASGNASNSRLSAPNLAGLSITEFRPSQANPPPVGMECPAARPLSALNGSQPALSKISHTWRKVYWVGATDSRVERVLYPGLSSHPAHDIAARQMTDGFGGMMSILVRGGFEEAKRLCTRLRVIVPATSLGGVESLAEHRKSVEGPASPVPDNLVRLSVGIEHVDDLIADLEQALAGL